MISQKEKLVFGILYSLFALALVVCGIMNIITGAWGLAVFVLGVSAFDIWQAIESFRSWFRYQETIRTSPIFDDDEEELETIYDYTEEDLKDME